MPQVSIIVPVYQVEPYLRRCVESILNQTFTDFELILVDDGSPDNCPTICDAYAAQDPRIVVIHQSNGGLSAARNAGIGWAFSHSSSQWLMFVDSDDWIHQQMLQVLMGAALAHNADIALCHCEKTDGSVKEISEIPPAECMDPEAVWITEPLPTVAVAKLYRKSLFQNVRYPVGKIHEDEYVTYRLLFACPKIPVIRAPLYYYFQNPNGIMGTPWTPKRLDSIQAFHEQALFFQQNSFPWAYRQACNWHLTICASQYQQAKASAHAAPEHLRLLRKQTRIFYRRLKKIAPLPFQGNEWIFEVMYPRAMQCYWYALALKRKLAQRINKH